MIDDLRRRSAAVVFEDHLRLASEHQFEEDISSAMFRPISSFSSVEAFSEAVKAQGSWRGFWNRNCRRHLTCTRIAY
jgi:hypothetical protein